MSSPTAAAPVAVLVLAWDETTPAVRALVEATEVVEPVIDSVVVVVPAAAGAIEELTQEEFLPLANVPALPDDLPPAPIAEQAPLSTEPATTAPDEAAISTEAALPVEPIIEDSLAAPVTLISVPVVPANSLVVLAAPTPLPTTEAPATPTSASLGWAAVRVLSLSGFSLPELSVLASQQLPLPIWTGTSALPAAPYLGNSEANAMADTSATVVAQPLTEQPTEAVLDAVPPVIAPLSPEVTALTFAADNEPVTEAALTLPPIYLSNEPIPMGADFEQSENPLPIEEESVVELAQELSDEEELATEAENQGQEADELLATAFVSGFAPEQANWHEALASLRQPGATEPAPQVLPEEASSGEPLTPPVHPALLPTAGTFEAPNLNFQVIQYARFAVPVALAEQPFEVVYAPTWPTWLAAQELRQRTGKPLVLHVATLAAGDEESVDTATGWVAELQRQVLRRADLVLTETPALAYRLREELNLSAATVRAVPAADAAAIAHALQTAHVRPTASAS
jgi:hypothetical protein